MTSRVLAAIAARLPLWLTSPRSVTWPRSDVSALVRRLAHFWVVWSALLLVHETGHAIGAWHQGLAVRRITAGVGPIVWEGHRGSTEVELRLVPLAGLTSFSPTRLDAGTRGSYDNGAWSSWSRDLTTIVGGVLATLAFALAVAGVVAARERSTRIRWRWGRYVVADAVVLTLFNFLPVPPLDGGRAVISTLSAWRGVHLTGDILLWVQVGGVALAVIPMTVWTRWTARIDALALGFGAPGPRSKGVTRHAGRPNNT